MASRNRNRPSLIKEDADEERNLWYSIRSDARRVDSIIVRPPWITLLMSAYVGSSLLNHVAGREQFKVDTDERNYCNPRLTER